jgi:hypothetical protein
MLNVLLGIASAVVALLLGVQIFMTTGAHKPSGPLVVELGAAVATMAVALAAIASLILISKPRRNWRDFLKAYVAFGAMASLGTCSSYMDRFHGEPKTLASTSGRLELTAPSDWSVTRQENVEFDLATMDWAGAYGVNALIVRDLSADDVRAAEPGGIETMADVVASNVTSKFGEVRASVPCGDDCALRRFDATIEGSRAATVLVGVRIVGETPLMVMGLAMGAYSEDRVQRLLDVVKSIRPAVP